MRYATNNDNRPLREATDEVWTALQAAGKSPETISDYKEKWAPFYAFLQRRCDLLPLVGDFTLQNVQHHLVELQSPDRGRQLAPSSVRCAAASLSAVAHRMCRQELTGTHRLKGLEWPKASGEEGRVLADDEVLQLLGRAAGVTQSARCTLAMLGLLYDVGPRVSELVSLDAEAVDFDAGWIALNDPAKNGIRRVLPLGRETRRLVRDLLGKRRKGPLFLGRGGMRMTDDAVRSRLVRLSEAAGVTRVSPHDFRRTAATTYEMLNAGEALCDRVFGWRPRTVASRSYKLLTREQIARAHQTVSPLDHLNPFRGRRDRAA